MQSSYVIRALIPFSGEIKFAPAPKMKDFPVILYFNHILVAKEVHLVGHWKIEQELETPRGRVSVDLDH